MGLVLWVEIECGVACGARVVVGFNYHDSQMFVVPYLEYLVGLVELQHIRSICLNDSNDNPHFESIGRDKVVSEHAHLKHATIEHEVVNCVGSGHHHHLHHGW